MKTAAPRGALRTFCNLISGFIYITSEVVFVKAYAEAERNMNGKGIVFTIILALFFKVPIQYCIQGVT